MKGKDKISGGLSDDLTIEDVAKKHGVSIGGIQKELNSGIKVEMEHTDSKEKAEEIALDHIFEIPDYYKRLKDMENKAEKEMNEGKENITAYAKRMRELAGLSEGNQNKTLKTIQEGESSFEGGQTFYAKDMMTSNDEAEETVKESEEKDDFETHKFEQKTIEEGADDAELYNLNENTIIVLDFIEEDED